MEKTKNEIVEILKNRTDYLYKCDCLTRKSYLSDCVDYILANEISEDTKLKDIGMITRIESYNVPRNERDLNDETNRAEEWLVINIFQQQNKLKSSKEYFGEILNYQVPLKNSQKDKCGKIDFISKRGNELLLVEIKAEESKESILKALLEIQTYSQIVDIEKLKKDFVLENEIEIKKVVAIFKDTIAHEQLKEDKVMELIKRFNIEVLVLDLKCILDLNIEKL